MESKARLLGHPIHQMLVVFPLGLLGTSVVFDLIWLLAGREGALDTSYALIAAGLVGALIAAPFGTIDWLAIPPGTRARSVGGLHGGGNMLVVLLFGASWWLRHDAGEVPPPTMAFVMSFAGVALSGITAWLGGELVSRLGVGVSPHAHLDAPSSLKGPAEPPQQAAASGRVDQR